MSCRATLLTGLSEVTGGPLGGGADWACRIESNMVVIDSGNRKYSTQLDKERSIHYTQL